MSFVAQKLLSMVGRCGNIIRLSCTVTPSTSNSKVFSTGGNWESEAHEATSTTSLLLVANSKLLYTGK